MSYEPIMIDNFVEGYRTREEPWRLPQDAWFQLDNGYTYRGNTIKRQGYNQFAIGGKGGAPFCESRVVVNVVNQQIGEGDGTDTYSLNLNESTNIAAATGDGTMGPYNFSLSNPARAVTPSTLTIEDAVGVQTVTDDGAGSLTGDGTGTVEYDTGTVAVTFTANVGLGDPITASVTFDALPIRRGTVTITAGLQVVTDDGLGNLTGDGTGLIDYTTGAITIVFNAVVAGAVAITATYDYHPDEPVMGIMNFWDVDGNEELVVVTTRTFNTFNESTNRLEYEPLPAGFTLTGGKKDFFHWVNYPLPSDQSPRLLFCNGVDPILVWNGTTITTYASVATFTTSPVSCKRMHTYFGRLILIRVKEAGAEKVRRILVSGTKANGDDFTATDNGAGTIDIRTNTPIISSEINRSDLMVVTQRGNYIFKYTNNDAVPFIIQQFNTNRGADAKMGAISYVIRTFYVSRRGLMETDGYDAVRIDDKIPDYIENYIDQDDFDDIFFGTTDDERQLWMLHRAPSSDEHNRALIYNYDEGSFAVYDFPFTCTGISQNYFGVTWDDLTAENGFPSWEAFGIQYETWDDIGGDAKKVITLAGGYHGQVWRVFEGYTTDNDVRIRGVSQADPCVITTDYQNYAAGDLVWFMGVGGTTELNGVIATVLSATNNTITIDVDSTDFSAYDSNTGIVTKVPVSTYMTPKFNPFVGRNKKARFGYIYFYVDTVEDEEFTYKDNLGEDLRPHFDVNVILGDADDDTDILNGKQLEVFMDETRSQPGSKKWYKCYVDCVGSFIQLKITHSFPTPFQLNAYSISYKEAGDLFV